MLKLYRALSNELSNPTVLMQVREVLHTGSDAQLCSERRSTHNSYTGNISVRACNHNTFVATLDFITTPRWFFCARTKPLIQNGGGGGEWYLIIFLGGGVPPGPENPYPISDQNIRFSIPYFRPDLQHVYPISDPVDVWQIRQLSIDLRRTGLRDAPNDVRVFFFLRDQRPGKHTLL